MIKTVTTHKKFTDTQLKIIFKIDKSFSVGALFGTLTFSSKDHSEEITFTSKEIVKKLKMKGELVRCNHIYRSIYKTKKYMFGLFSKEVYVGTVSDSVMFEFREVSKK